MPASQRRALPRAALLVLVTLVAVLAPLPSPARGGVSVVVPTDLVESSLGDLTAGTTVVPLRGRVRFVALSWEGAHDAAVTVATSANGTTYAAARDIGRDGVELEDDTRTWSGLLFSPGAAVLRISSDVALPDAKLAVIADRAPLRAGGGTGLIGERTAAAAVAQPDVVSRGEWGADESLRDQTYAAKSTSFHRVQKLIVHHTGDDSTAIPPTPEEHIRAIYRFHTGSRGFSDIGYNFLVSGDGRVFEGRFARVYAFGEEPTGEDTQRRAIAGAHASNYNSGTVGIALLGNFTSIDPAPAAVSALVDLLAWEAERHGIDPRGATAYDNPSSSTDVPRTFPNIAGHRDVGSTECPGGRLYAQLPSIRERVALRVASGGAAPTASPTAAPTGPPEPPPGGRFVTVPPSRALDTRDTSSPVAGGETRRLTLAGRFGVPASGASAVVVNVTAVEPTRAGFLTVYPNGAARPTASSLNFVTKQTVPNLVTVGLGSQGDIGIYASAGLVHVAVDVVGWYGNAGATDNLFAPLAPARLLDTRDSDGGGAIAGGTTRTLPVAGRGGVPSTGADAVVLNVTAAAPTAHGFLTVYPSGTVRPGTSNLNLVPRQVRPNLVVARLGEGGAVSIFVSSGVSHVVVDVVGWFGPPMHTGSAFVPGGRFNPVVPGRALDTRQSAPLAAGESRRLRVAGTAGVPTSGAAAVVLNVTAVTPTSSGFLTVHPAGGAAPVASSLNFTPGEVVPNAVVVGLGEGGEISILNSSGTTDVVVDVVGWYTTG